MCRCVSGSCSLVTGCSIKSNKHVILIWQKFQFDIMSDRQTKQAKIARGEVKTGATDSEIVIGLGFPRWQLAKTMKAMIDGDETGRAKAASRAAAWMKTMNGMCDGTIEVGSDMPVRDVPKWATLEVLRGGFASGNLMAGGPIQDWETELAVKLGVPATRLALNTHYTTEPGYQAMVEMLRSGEYTVTMPEESALLVCTWLVAHNDHSALDLLDTLAPMMSRVRLYPKPVAPDLQDGDVVCVVPLSETIELIRAMRDRPMMTAQYNAIKVWQRVYYRVMEVLMRTKDTSGQYLAVFKPGWERDAAALIREIDQKTTPRTRRATRGNLGALINHLRRAAKHRVKTRNQAAVRKLMTESLAKHGPPASVVAERRLAAMDQTLVNYSPVGDQVQIMTKRLQSVARVYDEAEFMYPVTSVEATDQCPAGTAIHPSMKDKVRRSRLALLETQVTDGVIKSGETLAKVISQIVSKRQAMLYNDKQLQGIARQTMEAFSKRRSLLLLNLKHQVQFTDLPWIKAIKKHHDYTNGGRVIEAVLLRIVILALTTWPHTILPNKLISALRSLVNTMGASDRCFLTPELAADIFMGSFTDNFTKAIHQCGEEMKGTIYEAYFRIKPRMPITRDLIATACISRAKLEEDPRSFYNMDVAYNGAVLEQVQVLTSHNLAQLSALLGLKEKLGPRIPDMVDDCVKFMQREIKGHENCDDYHARLTAMKRVAYCWRQMIFWMSWLALDQARDRMITALNELPTMKSSIDNLLVVIDGLMEDSRHRLPSDRRPLYGWGGGTERVLGEFRKA